MDAFILIAATLVLLILLYYVRINLKHNKNFPSGPRDLPVFGNLLSLACKHPHKKLIKWAETYGNVTGLYFGNQPVIVLNDWTAVREAFIRHGDTFSARFNNEETQHYSEGLGIAFSNGELWKEQRKYVASSMKGLGFGKATMQDDIAEGAREIIQSIKLSDGKAISTDKLFDRHIINILWKLVAGGSIENVLTKLESDEIIDATHTVFQEYGKLFFASFMSFIYNSPITKGAKYKFQAAVTLGKIKLQKIIDGHKTTYNSVIMPDFIDLYLKELEKKEQEAEAKSTFSEKQLQLIMFDLLLAGMETSSSSLRWLLAYMCKHKTEQRRVQNEIDDLIGKNTVSLDDKAKLVYTEAVILEVLRLKPTVPLSLPRKNIKMAKLLDYTIPANTLIFTNLYAVHNDTKLWDKPELFNPDRFIQDGKIEKPVYLMPFAIGKRVCLGEALAKQQMFIFFTSILQHYSVEFDHSRPEPDFDNTIYGATLQPPQHFIKFTYRVKT